MLKNKKYLFLIFVAVLLTVSSWLLWPAAAQNEDRHSLRTSDVVKNGPQIASAAAPAFDKTKYSTDEASSLWVIVNKGRVLPGSYSPGSLVVPNVALRLSASSPEMHVRSDMAKALETMFIAAKSDGVNLMLSSGYRSYAEQVSLYNSYVVRSGVTQADTYSARPGHSEHQTGLAADIEPASRNCEVDQCFADTPEGKWVNDNAYKFGFVIRYEKATESLTGYEFEPWHVRYVGDELAAQLKSSDQTLEQFFGLPAYQNYPTNIYELKNS